MPYIRVGVFFWPQGHRLWYAVICTSSCAGGSHAATVNKNAKKQMIQAIRNPFHKPLI